MPAVVCEISPLKRSTRPNVGIPRITNEIINWLKSQGLQILSRNYQQDASQFSLFPGASCSYSGHWLIQETTGNDILTIHDCREIEHPYWSPHSGALLHERVLKHWSRGGTIHTLTNTVANSIRATIGDGGKICVARLDPLVNKKQMAYNDQHVVDMNYTPYFVVIGSEALHKGHIHLLDCWATIPNGSACLYMVGPRSSASSLIDKHPTLRCSNVFRLGDMPERQKINLIQSSTAVIAPSMHEGLGIVPIEALQLGVPVIASQIPAHLEVAENYASYFKPESEDLTDIIREAIAGNIQRPSNFIPKREYDSFRMMFNL